MKRILITLVLLAIPVTVLAQGTSSKTLEYMYVGTSLSEVNTYNQVISVNNSVLTAAPTCVAKGTDVVCSVPITTTPAGNNVISVTAIANGQAAETVLNYNPTAPGPKQPNNPRLKIVVIINVP